MKHVVLQCPRCGHRCEFFAPAWPCDREGTLHGRGCLGCLLSTHGTVKVMMEVIAQRDVDPDADGVPVDILVEHPPVEEGGDA